MDSLQFRLQGSSGAIEDWGHEYVRYEVFVAVIVLRIHRGSSNLAGEIIQDFANRQAEEKDVDDLMALVDAVGAPF